MADIFDDEPTGFDGKSLKKEDSEFSQLFEQSLGKVKNKLAVGDRLKCEILSIGKEEVFVSTGSVNDGIVLKNELLNEEKQFVHQVGDSIDLFVVQIKEGVEVRLSSHPTAKNIAEDIEDAYDMMLSVEGRVTELCKGGFRINIMGKTAFCPISQMDIKKIEHSEEYIGKKFDFRITQFSEKGKNIVVSRRVLLDEERELSQATFMEDFKEGDIVKGAITRVEKFGVFVEIKAGIDGLCHISELSWSRIEHPDEVCRLGDLLTVKILKVEEEAGRFKLSLSVKQVSEEPWTVLPDFLKTGAVVSGKVTRCVKFGAFVSLAPGIEGLIPLSEMSYTKRVLKSDDLIKEGETISVMIKEIKADDKRMTLSLKDAGSDPWSLVPQKYPIHSVHKGTVVRKELYGLFIQLEEGVTGLLPKSKSQEHPEFSYDKTKVGDSLVVLVKELKFEERKMSLDIPQDPDHQSWQEFSSAKKETFGTFGDQFKNIFKK